MKRIIIAAILMMTLCGITSAQTYYRMYFGGGGANDYISNFGLRTGDFIHGIDFTTADFCNGFVTTNGVWGIVNGNHQTTAKELYSILISLPEANMGIQGKLYVDYVSAGLIAKGPRNSIDLDAFGGYSNIRSKGDAYGLSLSSEVAKKIYMYDKVYFNQAAWMTVGPGRNDDPTINNANTGHRLRIGSTSGLSFWGGAGVEANENPQLAISGTSISSYVPYYVHANDKVNLIMGTSATDETDGWIGTVSNSGLHLGVKGGSAVYLGTDYNLYMGLSDSDVSKIRAELKSKYSMFIAKGILSEDFAVAPKASWADFVFRAGYKLPVLSEVESFIKTNEHLPDVPSAEKIAEEGYSQHDMNKILLQKIEELTLYTIQQQKEIEELRLKLQETK